MICDKQRQVYAKERKKNDIVVLVNVRENVHLRNCIFKISKNERHVKPENSQYFN